MSDERRKALTEAWQTIYREVKPLGGYSAWNNGFTTALNRALDTIIALRDEAGEPRG
jgi:DNA gyrase inhibitor GyrI